jgi:hypothetical protein
MELCWLLEASAVQGAFDLFRNLLLEYLSGE